MKFRDEETETELLSQLPKAVSHSVVSKKTQDPSIHILPTLHVKRFAQDHTDRTTQSRISWLRGLCFLATFEVPTK